MIKSIIKKSNKKTVIVEQQTATQTNKQNYKCTKDGLGRGYLRLTAVDCGWAAIWMQSAASFLR